MQTHPFPRTRMHLAALLAVGLLALVLLPGAALAQQGQGRSAAARAGDAVPERYIVTLTPGAAASAVARAHAVVPTAAFNRAFTGFVAIVPEGRLNALRRDPRVEAVVPDRVIWPMPGRPGKPKRSGASTGSETVPSGVQRIGAAPAASLGVTGVGVGVAVLDTGVDRAHVDLRVGAACFDAFGGDCADRDGHGTHVAGTIAALANGVGVVGAAPGATIYAVKVLDGEQGGSDAALLAGIEWVLENAARVSPPIRVVNMSLGRPGGVDDNPALRSAVDALLAAGLVLVAAAGNDPTRSATDQIPAAYPDAITVAATTALPGTDACPARGEPIGADTLAFFTSYTPPTNGSGVDLSAPGERRENIGASCVVDGEGILSLYPGDALAEMSGSSMAAPLVSGVAALLLERAPGLAPSQVAAAIRNGATNPASGPFPAVISNQRATGGILSAPGALALLP